MLGRDVNLICLFIYTICRLGEKENKINNKKFIDLSNYFYSHIIVKILKKINLSYL